MANKPLDIFELSQSTSKKLSDYNNWTAFLRSAAYQYKYPFEDQLLIYAQRPNATACANLDTWNNRLKRWINKGAKGIALLREDNRGYHLNYVFDISDTNSFYGNEVKLWQYNDKYAAAVIETLSNTFGDLEDSSSVVYAVISTAHNAVEDSKSDYLSELFKIKNESLLVELDEINLGAYFQQTAEASIAYIMMVRMGLSPDKVFEREDFKHIINFNTNESISVLGNAVSSISGQALREISRTIHAEIRKEQSEFFAETKNALYNKNTNIEKERNDKRDRDNDVYSKRRLSNTGLNRNREPSDDRQVWNDEENLSETEQAKPLLINEDTGNIDGSFVGDRPIGAETGTADSKTDVEVRGRNRADESRKPDEVGRVDEQLQTQRGRNSNRGAYQQLSIFENIIPKEYEQKSEIREAARTESGAAFSFILPQQIIDEVLCDGTNDEKSVIEICVEFSKDKSLEKKIEFLKKLYDIDGKGFIFDGNKVSAWWNEQGIRVSYGKTAQEATAQVVTWLEAAKRIDELLGLGRYAPQETLLQMRDYEYQEAAKAFWFMQRDLNYDSYPELKNMLVDDWFKGGFPDSTERIAEMLKTPDGLDTFKSITQELCNNYDKNPDIIRFHFSNPHKSDEILSDLYIPRKKYAAEELKKIMTESFITDDEIDWQLSRVYVGTKYNISTFFKKHSDKKERLDFLKTEFRTGGSTNYWYDSKGINISHGSISASFAKTKISWNEAAKRIERLLRDGKYFSEKELREDIPKYLAKQEQRSIKNEKVKFVDDANNLSDAEKLVLLPQRLALFAETMEPYEQRIIRSYELDELLDGGTELEADAILHDTEKRKKLSECMQKIGGSATGVYERNNGYNLSEEIARLQSITLHSVGDFYEIYGDEAIKAAEILQLNLTHKTVNGEQITMIGFPSFKLEDYVRPLNKNWYLIRFAVEREQQKNKPAPFVSAKQKLENRVHEQLNKVVETKGYEALNSEVEKLLRDRTGGSIVGIAADTWIKQLLAMPDDELREYAERYTKDTLDAYTMIGEPETETNLIGKEITVDGRRFIVDSINEASGSVSLKDITLENNTGFPILRSESVEWLKDILQKKEAPPQPEKITPAFEKPKPSRVENTVIYPEIPMPERNNFTITNDKLGYGGLKEKFKRNMAAINLLYNLEADKRLATPDEQEILSQYVGWGGLADAFDETKDQWAREFQELKTTLSPEEYEQARASTLNAHYTSPTVIKAIYKALENMGFKQGNILEPSCGIGNFMGLVPDSMSESKMYGIELDSITGRIAQQLYQKNSVAIQGFEDTALPDSFFDVAIGNVPFGNFKVMDKKYDKHNFLIHDFFFAKALDKVRPGGIVALITSKGTMDKQNSKVRKYIAQRADLIGAIRLPNNTFKANAGTEVTSDIIFLQKREKMTDIEPDWVHLGIDEHGFSINQYFVDNPDMILGEMTEENSLYGMDITCKPHENANLSEQLNTAVQNIHAEFTEYEFDDISDEEEITIPADPNVRNFSYTIVDGEIYFRENSMMRKAELNITAQNRVKGMIELQDCVRQLIEYQTEGYSDSEIKMQQEKLNTLYDSFTKKYGLINSRANALAFSEDSSYYLLCSLEILNEHGELERKADMFTKRTIGMKKEVTRVDTASEALAVSIGEKAKVDMELMMSLTDKAEEELVNDLTNVIFLNPQYIKGSDIYDKYLTADEYLSGNVRQKLRTAQFIAETDDTYKTNVEALTAVQPKDLTASEITVRLGSTWIPPEYIKQFAVELLSPSYWAQEQMDVIYFTMTGTWNVTGKNADKGVKALNTYGTKRINAYKIIEETLNLKDVRIFDYVENENGNRIAVLNRKETTIAQQKQDAIKTAFDNWIWKDPQRRETLTKLYNEKFNSNRPREFDGSHIVFNGMNPEIELMRHQKNAVARIMYGGNSLLGHVVGAGKTWTMAAAAMEMKRLGLCNKSLFVVPNHLTEQWATEFLQLYPAANILVATKKDFEMKNRKKFCGRISTGDYDAMIIGHSQFEKIPMSVERRRTILEKQLDEIVDGIIEAKANKAERFTVKQMERTKRNLKAKLDKLNDQTHKDDVVTFEELGVDRVFVDEAHYYKNLFAFTKMRNVGGISQTEAQKSSDLFMKSRYLDEITGGKGLIFATGTPISNSMVELYTMQRYLQYHTLVKNDLHHFDAWASTFGETVTAIELAPEGTGYRAKTRFARFFNLPELMAMFKDVADIQTADMLNLPVPEAEYHTVSVEPTEFQKEMVADLAKRAEKVRSGTVDPTEDNMLKITNDGRKLALDQRMINPMLPDDEQSKVSSCVNSVFEVWQKTAETRATQLVFCDLSTPKTDGAFSVYNSVREKLLGKGVPENEIAFIHDADSEVKKKELFSKVRKGDVRILLGSTPKMGAGTNVQRLLYASHDMDCPWRPADLEQRAGRIIRQGNTNEEVHIFRYVTKNTFDSYMWQTVENKQKFIAQIMTSKSPVRSVEDIDEVALSYAEIKAIATGDPHIKEKMDLDMQVAKLKLIKVSFMSQKYELEDKVIKHYPNEMTRLKTVISNLENDIAVVAQHPKTEDKFNTMTIDGLGYFEKEKAGNALLERCKQMSNSEPTIIGNYRGFTMELSFDTTYKDFYLHLLNNTSYKIVFGTNVLGNIQRIDNALDGLGKRLDENRAKLEETQMQFEMAKEESKKEFPQEAELKEKAERLAKLNALLNMDKKEHECAALADPAEDIPIKKQEYAMAR